MFAAKARGYDAPVLERLRVYVFVLYAVFIWIAVHTFRRRWPAFLILALSVPVGFLIVRGFAWVFDLNNGVLWFLAGVYELLILAVGLLVACGPRTRRVALPCHRCRYDLTGNCSGVCPECGLKLDRIHATRPVAAVPAA